MTFFFISNESRHTRTKRDWSSDVCSYDLGQEVPNSIDDSTDPDHPDNVGLEGQELLQLALDSSEATAANGEWTATADLTLKTPLDVEPGSYSSTVTLSLFEEAY